MFRELQNVFRQSLAAFRAELSKREPEDQVAELLSAMRREMTAARAALPLLEQEANRARAELERERALLEQCERRRDLADRIGDAETARVAREFADRHRERAEVLRHKAEATAAEWALRRREAEEMMRRYQEADANRFAMVAELRRSGAHQRIRSALDAEEGPFADFARMEDAVAGHAAHADAVQEVADLDRDPSTGSSPAELDERLRELKRRMGRE